MGSTDPNLFDTDPEPDFDRLTTLASMMIGAPIALLSLVDERRQFFKSAAGLPEPWASLRGTPLSHSFCRRVVERGAVLSVDDSRADPALRDNPAIDDLGVAAYLGEPVRFPSGRIAGSLCVIDTKPRRWTDRDRQILEALARSAENAIRLRAFADEQDRMLRDLRALNEALSLRTAEAETAHATLQRTLRRQNQLLAGLSHEMRTPLNGILGGVTLLETTRDPAKIAEYRSLMRASARALENCIGDLITYAQLGSGDVALEVAPFRPAIVARSAVQSASALAIAKGLTVDLQIDPATPQLWSSDGRRIEQVLVNLLGNAVKYTPAGQVGVSVGPCGEALALRVFDTGLGVPERLRETIFEPFNRGDARTASEAPGTGLGLAIARETAQRLGGSLTLERSVEGEGSTFLFVAPNLPAIANAGFTGKRSA